jgi:ABC-type uncharacterized transport system fused permease/ATPase subunit
MMTFLSLKETDNFYSNLTNFFIYLLFFLIIYALTTYLQSFLAILFRKEITSQFFNLYLKDNNYYHLNFKNEIDNPDQRITDDITSFTNKTIVIFFLILDSTLQLFAYSVMLWNISKVLFWFSIILSLMTNIIGVIFFGKKLSIINMDQYHLEANLRYSLIQLREYGESISFIKLENRISVGLIKSLHLIIENSKKLIKLKAGLVIFQLGSKNLITLLPTIYLSGMFFSNEIEFGIIEKGSIAFVSVLYSLTVISDQIQDISILNADSKRLKLLFIELNSTKEITKISSFTNNLEVLKISNFNLYDFTNKNLINSLNLTLNFNDKLLITGSNGSGKTLFYKTLSGIHKNFSGNLELNTNISLQFIPQKTSLSSLSFFEFYELDKLNLKIEELIQIYFPLVNLDYKKITLDLKKTLDTEDIFSPGVLQKLILIKIFLFPEFYYFMDESMSSIDENSQEIIYQNFIKYNIKYCTISHNKHLFKYHNLLYNIDTNIVSKI